MARTELTKTDLPGKYVDAANDLNLQAMDAVNGNSFASTGDEFLILKNDDVAQQTVTVKSVEDKYGRAEDIDIVLEADEIKVHGPYPIEGWRQADKMIYLDTTDADVKAAVMSLSA